MKTDARETTFTHNGDILYTCGDKSVTLKTSKDFTIFMSADLRDFENGICYILNCYDNERPLLKRTFYFYKYEIKNKALELTSEKYPLHIRDILRINGGYDLMHGLKEMI